MMKVESGEDIDNIIVPQRFIPFDIGTKITEQYVDDIKSYVEKNGYSVLKIPGLLRTISQHVLLKIIVNASIKLYIFSYGIGVFVLEDNWYSMDEKYAAEYCEYRKKAHNNILNFCHEGCSKVVKEVINDIRKIVKKEKNIRTSASDKWEYQGLSYVMTVSYVIEMVMLTLMK